MPKPAWSELAEHLTSVEHSLRSKYPNEDEGGDPVPKPALSGLAEHSTDGSFFCAGCTGPVVWCI